MVWLNIMVYFIKKYLEKLLPEIKKYKINYEKSGSLEAQISSISDDIAYNCHDKDDGLRKVFIP